MNQPDEFAKPTHQPTDDYIDMEAYIAQLGLEDIRSWTKEAQAAYIRARLKARQEATKSGQKPTDSYSHWDLF